MISTGTLLLMAFRHVLRLTLGYFSALFQFRPAVKLGFLNNHLHQQIRSHPNMRENCFQPTLLCTVVSDLLSVLFTALSRTDTCQLL